MRRMKKQICKLLVLCFLLTAAVAGSSFTSDAKSGTWKHNKKGWWYSYSDGTYAKNQWLKSGGKWYYFQADGYMETNAFRQGYWLGKDGACSTKNVGGTWKKAAKGWWFTDKTGWYPKKQWLKINGKYYYFGADGYLVTNEWIGKECVNADGVWVPNASKAWVKAYIEEVKSFEQDVRDGSLMGASSQGLVGYYTLCYLDNNSTPDILMSFTREWSDEYVLSYHDGKASRQRFGTNSVTGYIPKTGLVLIEVDSYKAYLSSAKVFQLKNGKMEQIAGGSYQFNDPQYYDPNYEPHWTWNGEDVTEAQYNASLAKAYDRKKNVKGKSCSYDEMLKLLNSYLD